VFPERYELAFYIQEDGILHSHRRENLKSYNFCTNSFDTTVLKTLGALLGDAKSGPLPGWKDKLKRAHH
jgi:hypothetical protein